MKTLNFKSIKVENEEEIISKTGQTRFKLVFKGDTVEDHSLNVSIVEIVKNKSWIVNFFLTLMIIGALFALIYGILVIGIKIDFQSNNGLFIKKIFLSSMIFSYLALWIGLSIPSSIKNIKQSFVNNARGKGNWKIVDEKDWEYFSRLLALSEKKEEL